MILFRKIEPKGVDKNIDKIQLLMNRSLPIEWANVNCYHRVYSEELTSGIKPMIVLDGKNYFDVLTDTKKDGVIFFYEENNRNGLEVEINIVFQLKLSALYGSIIHRADEEVHDLIMALLMPLTYNDISLFTGLKNVYADFNTTDILFDDIGKFHCFRVKIKQKVSYCGCISC